MRSRTLLVVGAAALLVLVGYGLFGRAVTRDSALQATQLSAPSESRKSAEQAPGREEHQASPQSRSSAPANVAMAPAQDDKLMQSLREAFPRAPLETLERARQAERESPEDPNAAERSWIIVRCLVSLGRFHEAREEAKLLVARSPQNEWAIDVQKHLLVNPLDYPSREELQALAKVEAQP